MQYHSKRIFINTCLLFFIVGGVLFTLWSAKSKSQNTVLTVQTYNTAVINAQLSNVIILVTGVWKNTELVFKDYNLANHIATRIGEDKTRVIPENYSNFRIAGKSMVHIVTNTLNKVGITSVSKNQENTVKNSMSVHFKLATNTAFVLANNSSLKGRVQMVRI
ncbi:hypothetical protein [Formosa sp. L2A11]|uniref:hypothetical protein n=1 Tax=Formosa sp. L2A11 TaxID=2686363 RepID=UPI00131A8B36|nr:hypothetical protein [Formosa sp. L2A11]